MIRYAGILCVLLIALSVSSAVQAQEPVSLPELYSRDGVLSTTLVAANDKIRVGDLELDGTTYNGVYAGPVLHVHPGDLLQIRLVNHLSQPTNLHFHGIRTSPLGNSDNAHLLIQPNASFSYEVRIPLTQPIGLYWYHTHAHGFAEKQVMGGLSGTIVVEGPTPSPMAERLFVLKDMVFDDDTGNAEIDDTLHGIVQTVNGQLMTSETMRPGETQLWRLTNQSADRVVHVALDGHHFRVLAEDGEPTAGERYLEVLELSPGTRLDVLVDGGAIGHYSLRIKDLMTGTGDARVLDRVIGSLDVIGTPAAPAAAMPSRLLPPDLRAVRIDATRTVVFSQTTTIKEADQKFFINGKVFVADRIDARVPLGNTEEWTVRNASDDIHVFHIHQIGFQVVEVNGKSVPFAGYVDTVRVPERGEVKLRLAFTDRLILGRFMFHCHVLKHEDKGMMANIEIYDPTTPTLGARLNHWYLHVWWWWHGVPWSLCGLQDA